MSDGCVVDASIAIGVEVVLSRALTGLVPPILFFQGLFIERHLFSRVGRDGG